MSRALPAVCDPAGRAFPRSQDALVPRCYRSVQPQLEGLFFLPKVSAPGPPTLVPVFSLCMRLLETAPMPLASLAWRKPPARMGNFPLNSGHTSPELQLGCLLLPLWAPRPFPAHPSPFYSLLSWQLPTHCRAWPPQPHPMLAPAQARARGLSPSPRGLDNAGQPLADFASIIFFLLRVEYSIHAGENIKTQKYIVLLNDGDTF